MTGRRQAGQSGLVHLVAALVSALVALMSGLLIFFVAPMLVGTGVVLVVWPGPRRWVGVGMIAGVVVTAAGLVISGLAARA